MSHTTPVRHRSPIPNWLKAWYAFLAFMAVVVLASLIIGAIA